MSGVPTSLPDVDSIKFPEKAKEKKGNAAVFLNSSETFLSTFFMQIFLLFF